MNLVILVRSPARFTPAPPKVSTNLKNSPFRSFIMEWSRASSPSLEPDRSATVRSLSKFMFAPLVMATTRLLLWPLASSHFLAPATARAPDGSVIERVSSKMSLIATQISSVSTRMTSSTRSRAMRRVSVPVVLTATPSAKVSTLSRTACAPVRSDSNMALAPSGSTPMINTSGLSRFTYAAIPAMRPPPPTGTKMASMGWVHARRISIPMVPWPAMTKGWSKGGMNCIPSASDRATA
mmetsp:Transcript_22766/g.51347  ORF Transcript_22766/g.51347 Transcript_22766/m.51347 type:complete len:238 (-) Transcript_22766:658-1371(-)